MACAPKAGVQTVRTGCSPLPDGWRALSFRPLSAGGELQGTSTCRSQEWACKNLRVSNTAHPKWTLLEVEGEPQRQGARLSRRRRMRRRGGAGRLAHGDQPVCASAGFLLELASVISGTGAQVKEAYIQGGPTGTTPPASSTPGQTGGSVSVATQRCVGAALAGTCLIDAMHGALALLYSRRR